ncbi:MAG: choice-of-anchor E domain-containing protein [Phycisphaerae bacterium]
MHRFNQALCAAATLSVLATAAQAATVTFGPILFDNGGLDYTAGSNGSFSMPQFDPGLGTLLSVTVEVTGNSFGGSNALDNQSAQAGEASVTIGSNIFVTGPSSLLILTQPSETNSGPVAADDGGPIDFIGPDAISVVGTSSTDTDSDLLTTSLSPYIGLGSVIFNFSSFVNTANSATVSPTFSTTSPPSFNFTATVTYEYIPEPTGLSLLALGALPMVRRRRA